MVFCLVWLDHHHQNNSRLATKDIKLARSIWNYFFWRKKSTFPQQVMMFTGLFLYRSRRRHRHILHSLLVIRTKKSFISSTFFQRPINPMPINSSNKKPTIQDIRFTIVFPRFFPTKLTIVMLIGIRHCQVSTNYCDNDCMFVMFISSSNEETGEKYA